MKSTRPGYLIFFIALLLLGGLACNALAPGEATVAGPDTDEIVAAVVATLEAGEPRRVSVEGTAEEVDAVGLPQEAIGVSLEGALIDLYRRANPSVVHIFNRRGDFALGEGSGFIFDEAGHIVTNNHVVQNGTEFEVVFANDARRLASVVGTDVDSDLAVIKVDDLPQGARPVELGSSEELQVGQVVAAIGNPFGEEGSMSLGIVSGLGRSLASQRVTEDEGQYSLPRVIQTDAPINPGNSGGPLLNLQGQVVGVSSAIRTTTGLNTGVGFAIPVEAVKQIVPVLISEGAYVYPFLGIGTWPALLNLAVIEELGLPQTQGVYVTGVTPGSPADEAGIIAADPESFLGGDLIVGIDTREVLEFGDLISYLVFDTEPGQTVELEILRSGERITVPLTLGVRPEQ